MLNMATTATVRIGAEELVALVRTSHVLERHASFLLRCGFLFPKELPTEICSLGRCCAIHLLPNHFKFSITLITALAL